jgi:ABC-type polysaccharide/polyol phosphate export permease
VVVLVEPGLVYITLARSSMLNEPFMIPTPQLVSSMVCSIAVLALGSAVFRRWEKKAVKFL